MKTLIELVKGSHHVHRWAGQEVNGHRRSISEHHAEVFIWVKEILENCPITKDYFLTSHPTVTMELYNHAMLHDIPEVFTGDIPYTTKLHYPEIKATLNQVEAKIEKQYKLLPATNLTDKDKMVISFVVKVADMFVVYDEFVDYKNAGGIEVMKVMSENVFLKYCKPDSLLPLDLRSEIIEYYIKCSEENMIKKLEKLNES